MVGGIVTVMCGIIRPEEEQKKGGEELEEE